MLNLVASIKHLLFFLFILQTTELGISRKLFHVFIITNIIKLLYYFENHLLNYNLLLSVNFFVFFFKNRDDDYKNYDNYVVNTF